MKIIIVYASSGAGHFKAAQAIYNYFKEHCPEANLKLDDILVKCHLFFKTGYHWGYSFLVKHALFLWQFSFWITALKPLRLLTRTVARIINRVSTIAFAEYLIREQPDYIISTHFLPSEIASRLKKLKKIDSKVAIVITDFGVHPYWISEPVDSYIVASEYTKNQLIAENIDADKIRVLGIPVDAKFLKQYDKNLSRFKLGLNQDKFTVLITTGSFGLGPVSEIVRRLHNNAQILVVCANNKKLKLMLEQSNFPGVKAFGFIDNMPELMAAADLIITKPGGLTIAEALIMELVPIFICPIPGQEMENTRALEYFGVGLSANSLEGLKGMVLDYKDHPHKVMQARENIRKIKKPQILEELFDVVCKDSSGTGC